MAVFNADIALNLKNNGVQRQVQKIEEGVNKIERINGQILAIDKQIVAQSRNLLTLDKQSAKAARDVLRTTRLQRSELSLQKRELQGIVSLERRRKAELEGTTSTLGGLRTVAGALGAIGLGLFVRDAVRTSVALETAQIRLRALSAEYDNYDDVLSRVQAGQKLFNLTQQEAADQFSNAYARLRPLGLTLDQVQAVWEGFNVSAKLSGVSSAEAAGAFTQLSQALGAGALRGDELRSVLEQTPNLAKAIADELGITVGQLKEYGKEGKISSEAVLRALVRTRNEGVEKLSAVMDTPAEKFKALEIAGESFKKALADEALPAVTQAVETLGEIITALEGPIKFIGALANQTLGTVLDLINVATKPGQVASRRAIEGGRLPLDSGAAIFGVGPTADLFKGTGPNGSGLQGLTQQARELSKLRGQPYEQVLVQLMQDRLKTMDGALVTAVKELKVEDFSNLQGLNEGGNKKGGSKTDAQKQAERAAKALERATALTTELENQVGLLTAKDELEEKLRKIEQDRLASHTRIADLEDQTQASLQRSLADRIAQLKVAEAYADAAERAFAARKKEASYDGQAVARLNELTIAGDAVANAGEATAAAFKDAFTSIVTGSQTAQQAVAAFFKAIGNALIEYAALAISKYIAIGVARLFAGVSGGNSLNGSQANYSGSEFPGGTFGVDNSGLVGPSPFAARANGGAVNARQPYLVGEDGPELFIPGVAGTVDPSPFDANRGALRGGTAGGSEAFNENEAALATTTSLIRERSLERERLASMNAGGDTIEFSTYRVGELDVVSRDDAIAIGRDAAAKARAQVFSDMRNRPSTRSSLGLR